MHAIIMLHLIRTISQGVGIGRVAGVYTTSIIVVRCDTALKVFVRSRIRVLLFRTAAVRIRILTKPRKHDPTVVAFTLLIEAVSIY